MLILLIVLVVVATDACSDCGTTPPTPTPVPPPPCRTVTCGSGGCSGPAYTTCGGCGFGDVDLSTCFGFDGGPPGDADLTCEDIPCAGPSACVYSCDDPEPFYIGCCPCPEGTLDAVYECPELPDGGLGDGEVPDAEPPDDGGGLLGLGDPCADDRQCESGLCYGNVLSTGAFDSPTCQAMCLDPSDYGHYCLNDRHCCGRTCCVGCGEREGLCLEGT